MGTSTTATGGRHARHEASSSTPGEPLPPPPPDPPRWHACARGACWAGLFGTGLTAGLIFGPTVRTALLTAGAFGPFGLALTALHCAGRRQVARAQAAWRRGESRVIEPGPDTVRVGACEERIADCEDIAADVVQRVKVLEAGLEAAFDAAGISSPWRRPYLRLVREHATGER